MPNETTPLLVDYAESYEHEELSWHKDHHSQFCMLTGAPPSTPVAENNPRFRSFSRAIPRNSLYGRATRQLSTQRSIYYFTATLANTLLLSQVVLGAALTALGASASSHLLITLFGAANTIIAGLVAYLKSRGQPMRARMFLDDLYRVVGEIENSQTMWLGVTHKASGYEDIDVEDGRVSVRSEVARLTRLYDRAVYNNSSNNPDLYNSGSSDSSSTTSKSKSKSPQAQPFPIGQTLPPVAAPAMQPAAPAVVSAPAAVPVLDEVEPALAAPTPAGSIPRIAPGPELVPQLAPEPKKEETKGDSEDSDNVKKDDTPASAPEPSASQDEVTPDPAGQPSYVPPPMDPDASPASDANLPLKSNIKVSRLKNGEA